MKKNKGFTLVEMLGVLIILIVVFMIMFPSLTKIIKDTNDEIDNATLTVIEDATTDFLLEKNDVYPKNDDYTYCITIEQLLDNGNLTDKEISSLSDTNKFVKTTFQNGKNVYVITDTCSDSKPSIEFALIGDNNMSFEVGVGGQYVEPGATAKNKAGEVVSYVTTITNKDKATVAYVDTTKIGVYTVKYSATLDGEDYAIERIVKVIDTTAPIITVSPTTETISITNITYNVLNGVTSSDNSGINPKITASTNLILGQAGTYTITYTATDKSGNKKIAKRTVTISNGSLASVTLVGKKLINYYTNTVSGTTYNDAGATAVDNNGLNLTSSLVKTITSSSGTVSNIETSKSATYYVTYSIIKDGVTYSETRTVKVIENSVRVVYFNPVAGSICTAGQAVSTPGTKTGCMKWYVFNDTGETSETVNLILDHNTTATTSWNYKNITGPSSSILNQLAADTNSWVGVPTRTDIYTYSNLPATYEINYTINYGTYKARFITAAEIAAITGNTTFIETETHYTNSFYFDSNNQTQTATIPGSSKYSWLFDYTNACTSYGCNIADSSTNGFWTASASTGFEIGAWCAYSNGSLYSRALSECGIRPVITIPRSLLG